MIYAKYTIVLKTLLDDPESKALIDQAMSTYPLYTAENEEKFNRVMTREELNKMILDHFKYREIGFETFGRFLDELEIALNEIMPTYNQYFVSQDIINGLEDIFGNVDMKVTFEQEITGNSTDDTDTSLKATNTGSESIESTSETDSETTGNDTSKTTVDMSTDAKNVSSKTPQSQLSITSKNIDGVTYADQVDWKADNSESETNTEGNTHNTTTATTQGSSTNTREDEKEETGSIKNKGSKTEITTNTLQRKGNHGVNTYAHDMKEFRELFINVGQMIINDNRIQELFMQVY